jgi:hypothetical protein
MSPPLCYLLLSPCGRFVWCAPRFHPVDGNLARAQRFPSRALAVSEASRLKVSLRLDARPVPVRWQGGTGGTPPVWPF